MIDNVVVANRLVRPAKLATLLLDTDMAKSYLKSTLPTLISTSAKWKMKLSLMEVHESSGKKVKVYHILFVLHIPRHYSLRQVITSRSIKKSQQTIPSTSVLVIKLRCRPQMFTQRLG